MLGAWRDLINKKEYVLEREREKKKGLRENKKMLANLKPWQINLAHIYISK